MKKFIFLLCAIFAVMFTSVQAQTILQPKQFIFQYTGTATDTVGVGTTTWGKEILLNKLDGVLYTCAVKVSDYTAGSACTIALQGKIFNTDTYSTITTKTWYGGGTDTTVVFQNVASKIYYRYLKVLVTRTASKAKVDYVKLSLRR